MRQSADGRYRDRFGRFCQAPVVVVLPSPLTHPTLERPRYRLRVFDRCWPWRVSRREVIRDAVASHNARFDPHDKVYYLDACAVIQQDPPPYMTQLRWRMARSGG